MCLKNVHHHAICWFHLLYKPCHPNHIKSPLVHFLNPIILRKSISTLPEFDITPKLTENEKFKFKKPTYKNANFYDFRILPTPHDVENAIHKFGDKVKITHLIAALNRLKRLNDSVNQKFLNYISDAIMSKLDLLYAKDIAMAFHAMAKLKFNNKSFFENMTKVAIKHNYLAAYTPVDLSNLVYGIGLVQKQHEFNLGMKIIPSLELCKIERNEVFDLKNELCNALAKYTLISLHPSRLNEVQLSSIIYGFGLAKFQNIEDLNEILSISTAYNRSTFN